jgi:hypothetical protein
MHVKNAKLGDITGFDYEDTDTLPIKPVMEKVFIAGVAAAREAVDSFVAKMQFCKELAKDLAKRKR